MSDTYINGKFVDFHNQDDLYGKEKESSLFHLGQCYEDVAVKKLTCVKCGGDEFNVGQGSYYTAIRCPKCEWEQCIHDG